LLCRTGDSRRARHVRLRPDGLGAAGVTWRTISSKATCYCIRNSRNVTVSGLHENHKNL
jgi:hypothetical protein